MNNIQKFPKLNETVKELASKFMEEGGTLKVVVGGGTVGRRED